MATLYWRPQAGFRPQIDSITVAGTWAAADTVTVEIGNSALTVTMQSGTTTTSLVAAAIKNAINAQGPSDGLVANESRNAGGQQLPEFRDVEAYIDPTNTSKVLVRSKIPGVPFYDAGGSTLNASASTAGDGDVTEASVQTATGQWHWDNAANWSTGNVPANGDSVVFQEATVGPRYGLPGNLNVTLVVHQSFTGEIGLPQINTSNGMAYAEYRTRHAKFSDADASDDTLTHLIGLGEGPGSPLLNIAHENSNASPSGLTASAVVYNTGRPRIAGTSALNLVIDNSGFGGGEVHVLKGSVKLATQFGISLDVNTIHVGQVNTPASELTAYIEDAGGDLTLTQSGGQLLYTETGLVSLSGTRSITLYGGICTVREMRTSGTVTVTVANARLVWNTSKTITTAVIGSKGILDLEQDMRAVTITNLDLFEGASLLDEYDRLPESATIDLNRCGVDDVTLRIGNNKKLTVTSL